MNYGDSDIRDFINVMIRATIVLSMPLIFLILLFFWI